MRSIKLSPLVSAAIFYAGAILLGVGPAAHGAVTYGFEGITNNNAGDVTIAESQLSVEVFDRKGYANFKRSNVDREDSIADIYFDDEFEPPDGVASTGLISSDRDVSLSLGDRILNFLAGRDFSDKVESDHVLDSNRTVGRRGIDSGGLSYVPSGYGGNHRGISSYCIEEGNPSVVPEPCSILLSTIGMAVVGALKRRRAI
jgi:hypothetical protein